MARRYRENGKRRSSGMIWIIIAAAGVVFWKLWGGDGSGDDPVADQAALEAPVATDGGEDGGQWQASETPYALDASRADWPPLAEDALAPAAALQQVNYYIVLDGSGSMSRVDCSGNEDKITVAKRALQRFVQTVPADAGLGLTVFDDGGVSERVPLAPGTQPAVMQALAQVQASGGTPLRSSIWLAYRQLREQARAQLGYGEYHLVVVTDGFPDPSSEDPEEVVGGMLANSPVVLHTIGFCIGADHVLNQPGRVYYFAADTPEQLDQGLGSVLAESPDFDLATFPN